MTIKVEILGVTLTMTAKRVKQPAVTTQTYGKVVVSPSLCLLKHELESQLRTAARSRA